MGCVTRLACIQRIQVFHFDANKLTIDQYLRLYLPAMLVLTRKVGETIMIGDDIEVVLTRIERDCVRLAIKAPQSVRIFRNELYQNIQKMGSDSQDVTPSFQTE